MDWKAATQQVAIAATSSVVIASGVSYTQLVRLDERVGSQHEQTLIRIDVLLEKTMQLREEQLVLRQQIMQLQQQVWSSRAPRREQPKENVSPSKRGLADDRGKT